MLRDRARAAASVLVPRGVVNALLRQLRSVLGPARFDALMGRGHRQPGYRLLQGRGIEIGALHAPAPLPACCTVTYVDAVTTEQARALFPEIDAARLVAVDVVADLDTEGLCALADASFDFAVMNHVIEHVANPIRVIEELFRVVKAGGMVVISAPDMRFSFDRRRELTSARHLLDEYRDGVTSVTDEHYLEFVRATSAAADALSHQVAMARLRREHAHVWNSETFASFLNVAQTEIGVRVMLRYMSSGDLNGLEHFSVWEKVSVSDSRSDAS